MYQYKAELFQIKGENTDQNSQRKIKSSCKTHHCCSHTLLSGAACVELGTQQLGRIIFTEVKIMHSLFSDLWNKFFVSTKSNRNKITSPYDKGVLKINTLNVVRDLDTEVNGIITLDNFIFWFVTPPLLHLLHISCANSFC